MSFDSTPQRSEMQAMKVSGFLADPQTGHPTLILSDPSGERFLPIVTRATEKQALADKYNAVAGKAGQLGLVKGDDTNIQRYVTGKALDGLYRMIAEEEKKIRRDPIGTGKIGRAHV